MTRSRLCYSRALEKLTNFRNLWRSKRERERCYPSLRKVSLEASRVFYIANTSKIWRCPVTSASKTLLITLQNTKKSEGKFLCKHRNFPANEYDWKYMILTYQALLHELKNKLRWMSKRIWQREEDLEFLWASRDGFSTSTTQVKPLMMTCKSLVQTRVWYR